MKPCIAFLILGVGVALFIAGAVMLGIGIAKDTSSNSCAKPTAPPALSTIATAYDSEKIRALIQEKIDPAQIKKNLIDFTVAPHRAGSDENDNVTGFIVEKWMVAGLENVHAIDYYVLLSDPDFSNPNYLFIKDGDNVVYKSEGVSPALVQAEQNDIHGGIQWLAYSASGTVTGDVVYCGLGSDKNFQYLLTQGIDVKGKIALIRYGGMFRGNKVANAEKYGAIGAILFSDPAEVAPNGTRNEDVYPNTVYMPPHGVQRGTLKNGDGDPLTPLYPSIPALWHSGSIEKSRADGELPSIPVIPLSYSSAWELLSRMKGPAAPATWRGALNVTYNLGPGLNNNLKTTITVNGGLEVKRIMNVVGYLTGSEEPDRYVILGNHYDAWTYGAQDPNSGTAALTEVIRATMQVVNETSWRPARTLMFAAWDAEEYGLIGSTEFVEEFSELLSRRTVAYINMDLIKGNQTIEVRSVPSLEDQVVQASMKVQNPRKDQYETMGPTVYDAWIHYSHDPTAAGLPLISVPDGGSDQKAFMEYLGVPVVDFSYVDADKHDTYPLYHTLYETPFTNEHLLDTDNFTVHRAVAQYWIELALRFADAPTLPYSFNTLAVKLVSSYIPQLATAIQSMNMPKYTKNGYDQLQKMSTSASKFQSVTKAQEAIPRPKTLDPVVRNRYNDKLINVERCFVNPRGTPDDATARHVLFSVNDKNSYAGSVMQQVYKVLDDMADATPDKLPALGDELAQQISIVHYSILCAIDVFADYI
ncbi:hypothetical protein Q1695_012086 [Nippostrongylus brasiliensis]|nr:hypothetical protein Q1695_012086 [Nippostrongylus brasiliensis]